MVRRAPRYRPAMAASRRRRRFGSGSITGIALRNGYLYVAQIQFDRAVQDDGWTAETGRPTCRRPSSRAYLASSQHGDKGIAFDGKGGLYVNVGAPSNACQQPDRRPGAKGQDPCPLLEKNGGIWKFDENKLGQKQEDGTRFATGLRQMPAITWHDGAVYIVDEQSRSARRLLAGHLQGRRQRQSACRAALSRRARVGLRLAVLLLRLHAEEAPAQSRVRRRRSRRSADAASSRCRRPAFPRTGRRSIMTFYTGSQFPQKYRNGAFIAFHGSWNRSPAGRLQRDLPAVCEREAVGHVRSVRRRFHRQSRAASKPRRCSARPDGVAQGPDGSLYIGDSNKGKDLARGVSRG